MVAIDDFSDEIVKGIRSVLGDILISIIVYGSVAKGVQTDESDVDIALIIKGELDVEIEDRLSDFLVDMNLKYDTVFSVIDIDEVTFVKWKDASPFYHNVSKEGVVLWKAA